MSEVAEETELSSEEKILLSVNSLSKTFPGQVALDKAHFQLRAGEIHALVGQNGSGKSTLIKLLSGYIKADHGGNVHLFGAPVDLWHRDQRCEKIRVVHQDLGLVPTLNAVENLGLGRGFKTGLFGRIRWRIENAEAQKALAEFGVTPDVRLPVGTLSAAEQTAIAIVRALTALEGEGILILDEPTAALNKGEIEALFYAVRRASSKGVGVIFVSHILDEVLNLAERVTVLRDGKVVVAGELVETLDNEKLVREIVGAELKQIKSKKPLDFTIPTHQRLEVENLVGLNLRGVSFKVSTGEILGIAGVIGSGRDELAGTVFGASPRFSGKVLVDKNKVFSSPYESLKAGMAYVPADRKGLGLLPRHRTYEHITLPNLGPLQYLGFLNQKNEIEDVQNWMDQVDLDPPDAYRRMEKFSGGNQQKAVLARWLRTDPKVLLLSDPTQGVDVGAKSRVHELIEKAASNAVAVLLASSDIEELVRLCDRVLVMRGGIVAAQLVQSQLTKERLLGEVTGTENRRRGMRVDEKNIHQVVYR